MVFENEILKVKNVVETGLSKIVPNFHKKIKGVSTVSGLNYYGTKDNSSAVEVYHPSGEGSGYGTIVYFHGGGWTTLDKSMYQTLGRKLAKLGFVVFNCNYELAPKASIEKIIADAEQAVVFALNKTEKFGGNPTRLYLGGDSAGAHIAAMIGTRATAEPAHNDFADKIKGLLLFYGIYNFDTLRATKFPSINLFVDALFGKREIENKELMHEYSPVYFLNKNFPRSFLTSGGIDKLHQTQSVMFKQKLDELRIPNMSVFFDKKEQLGRHGFMSVDGIKTSDIAFAILEKFLKEEGK